MYTVGQIADRLAADLFGDRSVEIFGIGSIQSAKQGQITHLSGSTYRQYLPATNASAVILSPNNASACPSAAVVVDDPYVAYAKVSQLFDHKPRIPLGIHETAFIDASASLGADVRIGPFVSIGAESVIGDRVEIFDHATIANACSIGENSVLKSNVVIAHGVRVGDSCVIMEGSVIGSDGFGYATSKEGEHHAIAQLGNVQIGNHVDIGAKATIDRGALEDTIIEDGVKIDDQVHIGHNCRVGKRSIICGCAGLAGSVTIGDDCMIGGGVGIAGTGPLNLANGVYVSAMTFVSRSIKEPGIYSGHTLHAENSKWRRNMTRLNELDDLHKRVRHLERMLAAQHED